MQPQPEPPSLLARLDEAALYHRAEDRGFFSPCCGPNPTPHRDTGRRC